MASILRPMSAVRALEGELHLQATLVRSIGQASRAASGGQKPGDLDAGERREGAAAGTGAQLRQRLAVDKAHRAEVDKLQVEVE